MNYKTDKQSKQTNQNLNLQPQQPLNFQSQYQNHQNNQKRAPFIQKDTKLRYRKDKGNDGEKEIQRLKSKFQLIIDKYNNEGQYASVSNYSMRSKVQENISQSTITIQSNRRNDSEQFSQRQGYKQSKNKQNNFKKYLFYQPIKTSKIYPQKIPQQNSLPLDLNIPKPQKLQTIQQNHIKQQFKNSYKQNQNIKQSQQHNKEQYKNYKNYPQSYNKITIFERREDEEVQQDQIERQNIKRQLEYQQEQEDIDNIQLVTIKQEYMVRDQQIVSSLQRSQGLSQEPHHQPNAELQIIIVQTQANQENGQKYIGTIDNKDKIERNDNRIDHNADKVEPNADKLEPNVNEIMPNGDKLEPNEDKVETNADKLEPNEDKIVPNADEIVPSADERVENDSYKAKQMIEQKIKALQQQDIKQKKEQIMQQDLNKTPTKQHITTNIQIIIQTKQQQKIKFQQMTKQLKQQQIINNQPIQTKQQQKIIKMTILLNQLNQNINIQLQPIQNKQIHRIDINQIQPQNMLQEYNSRRILQEQNILQSNLQNNQENNTVFIQQLAIKEKQNDKSHHLHHKSGSYQLNSSQSSNLDMPTPQSIVQNTIQHNFNRQYKNIIQNIQQTQAQLEYDQLPTKTNRSKTQKKLIQKSHRFFLRVDQKYENESQVSDLQLKNDKSISQKNLNIKPINHSNHIANIKKNIEDKIAMRQKIKTEYSTKVSEETLDSDKKKIIHLINKREELFKKKMREQSKINLDILLQPISSSQKSTPKLQSQFFNKVSGKSSKKIEKKQSSQNGYIDHLNKNKKNMFQTAINFKTGNSKLPNINHQIKKRQYSQQQSMPQVSESSSNKAHQKRIFAASQTQFDAFLYQKKTKQKKKTQIPSINLMKYSKVDHRILKKNLNQKEKLQRFKQLQQLSQ